MTCEPSLAARDPSTSSAQTRPNQGRPCSRSQLLPKARRRRAWPAGVTRRAPPRRWHQVAGRARARLFATPGCTAARTMPRPPRRVGGSWWHEQQQSRRPGRSWSVSGDGSLGTGDSLGTPGVPPLSYLSRQLLLIPSAQMCVWRTFPRKSRGTYAESRTSHLTGPLDRAT